MNDPLTRMPVMMNETDLEASAVVAPVPEDRITGEVLKLVEKFCGPKVLTQFLALREKAVDLEAEFLGKQNGKAKKPANDDTLDLTVEHVLSVCRRLLDDYDYQRILLGIGTICKSHGRYESAEKAYDLLLENGFRLKSPEYIAEAYLRRGEVYARQRRWEKSEIDLETSRTMYGQISDLISIAKIDNILGANFAEQGEMDKAEQAFRKALRGFESAERKVESGMVLLNLGITENILGNYDEALNYYRRATPYFQEVGDTMRLAELHHNIGMSFFFKGRIQDAIREFDESLAYSHEIDYPVLLGLSYLGKANAYYRLEDTVLALTFLSRAEEHFNGIHDTSGIAEVYKVKGMIFRDRKRYDVAATFFQMGVHLSGTVKNTLNQAETYFEWALMEKKRRNEHTAKGYFQEALAGFIKIGAAVDVARSKTELAFLQEKSK